MFSGYSCYMLLGRMRGLDHSSVKIKIEDVQSSYSKNKYVGH